jgi:DNA repair ATPase RecN
MTIDRVLAEVLEQAVEALTDLDPERLAALEQRMVLLAESDREYGRDDIGLLISKRRQLEIALQNFHVNLDALSRLHDRNMRNRWAQ